ncbi:MAG: hypothetical protein CVU39_12945 [Chloroflexi bacterium HGW-Chloroflexi-10]|nr:MAG: hypothetical protein CVU39_12945 [Chloroflexi bacterium HGW-Chloroflexi-10]
MGQGDVYALFYYDEKHETREKKIGIDRKPKDTAGSEGFKVRVDDGYSFVKVLCLFGSQRGVVILSQIVWVFQVIGQRGIDSAYHSTCSVGGGEGLAPTGSAQSR